MSEGIPEGWETTSIGKLTKVDSLFSDGDWVESKDQDTAGNNRLIQLADIGDGRFLNKSARFMNDEQFTRLRCTPLKRRDILIARMPDPLGRACLFPGLHQRCATVVDVAIIRTTVADHYWLMSAINSPDFRRHIEINASGTTRTRISRGELYSIRLLAPPKPEQQKIAAILTSVDEVIEKTEAQIHKLQDLKKGMMQELLTKGIGHTEFKDSPVGRIPRGWDLLPLGRMARVERGKFSHRPRNDPRFNGGSIPFIQTGDVPKDSPYIVRYSQSLNDDGLAVSKLFKKGTLVITIAATVGEIGLLTFDSCFPDSLVGISVNPSIAVPGFVLYMMRTRKDELVSFAPQTAQKNINLETLNPFLLPRPPRKEQEKIANSIFAVDDTTLRLQRKLEKAVHTKKALMQDLLTGKVRVKVG